MLRFACPHCSAKLTAREERAGKTAACPHCKSTVTIPDPPEPELKLVREDSSVPLEAPDCVTFKAAPARVAPDTAARERQQAQELLASLPPESSPEYTGERKVFWLLDILLYPFSITGIVTLAVMIVLPLLSAGLGGSIFRFVRLAGWLSFGIGALLGLYMLWYLAECVYDSAKGGTRAPEIIDADTSFDTLWARGSYLFAVYFIYVGPVVGYWAWMRSFDAIFWALTAWVVLFCPMSLLAMVINDSLAALNPFFLIASICRVFLSYVGLVVCLIAMTALLVWISAATIPPTPHARALLVFSFVSLVADAYSSFLFAHILGRFYWRNRERLDWGI